jgi:hypothetical protein
LCAVDQRSLDELAQRLRIWLAMGSESSGGELQRAGTAYNLLSSPVEPQGQPGAIKKNDTERQPIEGPRHLIGANISRDQAYLQAQSTVEVGNQGAHAA